jgi:hypothetical protein
MASMVLVFSFFYLGVSLVFYANSSIEVMQEKRRSSSVIAAIVASSLWPLTIFFVAFLVLATTALEMRRVQEMA